MIPPVSGGLESHVAGRNVDTRIPIRWRDLDPLGHVNHEVFLTYLEHTRDTWLSSAVSEGVGPEDYVVARLEIDYKAELTRAMGWVVGCCRLAKLGRTSITTSEELVTPDGRVAAHARVVIVLWDAGARSPRPMTDAEREAFERAPSFTVPHVPTG